MKHSTDPKEIIHSVNRQNCNKMHMLANLMKTVQDLKMNHCYDELNCPNGEFISARSPEMLDEIMERLIYMFSCEANCGVGQVIEVNGQLEADICEFNENREPKK